MARKSRAFLRNKNRLPVKNWNKTGYLLLATPDTRRQLNQVFQNTKPTIENDSPITKGDVGEHILNSIF
jgi:hypothetical protein